MTRSPATTDATICARGTLLILTQVYVPDPASVGQHMADVAEAMARRGWRVVVLTANRGYDDPSQRYPRRETRQGVEVVRLSWATGGKKSLIRRLIGGIGFLLQAILYGLFVARLSCVLYSTSPPLCPWAAMIIGALRGVPIKYWIMDLNPDQLVALGMLAPDSATARGFRWMNRLAVRCSRDVVVLDRYMAQRIEAAADGLTRVHLIPPWPHERELSPIERNQNPFRRSHALQDKFVVMYSGNHSVASPLTTLIEAALRLQNNDRLRFLFVGGGVGKREVDDAIARHQPTNIVSLPYQPLDGLRYSLAAADLHVVALGNSMAGAIHPCKVYGAMAVGRPILYLGPVPSHVADLIEQFDCGWQIDHGNVDGMCRLLEAVAALPVDELAARGERAANAIRHGLSQQVLLNRFCNVLETGRDEPSGSPPTAVAETFEISKSN